MSVHEIKLSRFGYVQMRWALFKAWIKNPRRYYRTKKEARDIVQRIERRAHEAFFRS